MLPDDLLIGLVNSILSGIVVFFLTFPIANDTIRGRLFRGEAKRLREANQKIEDTVRAMLVSGQNVGGAYDRIVELISKDTGFSVEALYTMEQTLSAIQQKASLSTDITQESKKKLGCLIDSTLRHIKYEYEDEDEYESMPKDIFKWSQTPQDDTTQEYVESQNIKKKSAIFSLLFSSFFSLTIAMLFFAASIGTKNSVILISVVQGIVCVASFISMIRPGEKDVNFFRRIAYMNILLLCLSLLNIILSII